MHCALLSDCFMSDCRGRQFKHRAGVFIYNFFMCISFIFICRGDILLECEWYAGDNTLRLSCVLAQFSDLLVEDANNLLGLLCVFFLRRGKCGRVRLIFVHVNVVNVRMWLEGRIEKQC